MIYIMYMVVKSKLSLQDDLIWIQVMVIVAPEYRLLVPLSA